VAVRFAEISGMAALVEVGFAAGALQPDLSFGSHFFQDLVESGIFYAALFPGRDGCQFNEAFLEELPNRLPGLLPEYRRFAPVVRVVDLAGEGVVLLADLVSQQVVCGRIRAEE